MERISLHIQLFQEELHVHNTMILFMKTTNTYNTHMTVIMIQKTYMQWSLIERQSTSSDLGHKQISEQQWGLGGYTDKHIPQSQHRQGTDGSKIHVAAGGYGVLQRVTELVVARNTNSQLTKSSHTIQHVQVPIPHSQFLGYITSYNMYLILGQG